MSTTLSSEILIQDVPCIRYEFNYFDRNEAPVKKIFYLSDTPTGNVLKVFQNYQKLLADISEVVRKLESIDLREKAKKDIDIPSLIEKSLLNDEERNLTEEIWTDRAWLEDYGRSFVQKANRSTEAKYRIIIEVNGHFVFASKLEVFFLQLCLPSFTFTDTRQKILSISR